MFVVGIAVCMALGVVILRVAASSSVAGRLTRSLLTALRARWIGSNGLGRITQAAVYLLVATYVFTPAGSDRSTWSQRRLLVLSVLAAVALLGGVALVTRRVIRRMRRAATDERSWTARELMYADARRDDLAVLWIDREQYRTPVGQRCWTIDQATGDGQDTWFTNEWFPVGSAVLCSRAVGVRRESLAWLSQIQLAEAARHDQRVQRGRRTKSLNSTHSHREVDASASIVAEAESILRNDHHER